MWFFFLNNRRQIRSNRMNRDERASVRGSNKDGRLVTLGWWSYGDMCQISTVWKFLPSHVCLFSETCREEELSLKSDTSPRFIENTSNTLLTYCYLWKPQDEKINNCVILSQLFFCNGEFISHCILCNYLLYTWS